MALGPVRCIFFFEYGDYSWSESHHIRRPLTSLAQGIPIADRLAAARQNLLGASDTVLGSPRLVGYRLTDDLFRRDGLIQTKLANFNAKWDSSGDWDAVEPYDALLVRGEAADGHFRNFYLSSIPDRAYNNRGGIFAADVGEFATKWGEFAAVLTQDWSWPIINRDAAVAPKTDILNLTSAGPLVTLSPNDNTTLGEQVSVSYARFTPNTPRIGGIYTVIDKGAGTFTIRVPRLVEPLDWIGGGYYFPFVRGSRDYKNIKFVKKTHRKRGVHIFEDSRGRSLSRR